MSKYMTKQRKTMLDYLNCHADEALSARQIAEDLGDSTISESTVYRNLAALEQDGLVSRTEKAGSREVLFRYTDAEDCRECIHLSCRQCGKIFHMDTRKAEQLIHTIAKTEHFSLDLRETVLYGICGECRKI